MASTLNGKNDKGPPVNEQPANEQPANEQPVNEQPVNVQPANLQPANVQPVDEVIRLIDAISAFKSPSVHIRNRQKVEDFLWYALKGGKSKISVAADFDFTMSKAYEEGIRCQTCHGALNSSPLISKEVQDESRHLYELYHPIELELDITRKDKSRFMKEWWTKAANLIVSTQLNKKDIKDIVKESRIRLRTGCDEMIRKLHEHGIPLTVISAGLGDLIVEAIDQQSSMTDNIKIVANFMEFNDSGVLVAFKNDTIHCCNKNETPVHHRELFKRLSGRTNAILIGDLLEDSDMLDAVTHLEYVLKIGFLNDNNFEFFAKFMQKFDIVVENDETLDVVNGILQKLF